MAGIDLFERLLVLAHEEGRAIALLGARPDVLRKLEERLRQRFPGLRIAYSHHGYFGPEEAARIAEDVRAAGVDMLFLGMTTPKKEIFLGAYGSSLNVPVLHGVGGSFDVMAGLTRRAPIGWQRLGMEWAYRLLQEPRRLWWRYFTSNAMFVQLTAREMLRPAQAFKLAGDPQAGVPVSTGGQQRSR
ncbi:N-acetylmannosaminyltransferase (plasmid) [Sinorhizobium sojae CCBAU 05684]|uniref:N-acetylmannosaminyltransferase n=1 Tax=Sinorhizobium sojae CCBAU 05684 TaxID=716928 RepID=A0A249PJ79_9HYPH|nr:N-acetylmannosaminyltransferase [Sinorhizobium sojae CCBAU 05684]